jgi:signal transduction histidine kinase
VFAAARDISEHKALEEQLRRKNEELVLQNQRVQEANRLKSEFLANMSHELRTPLNGIIGFAELMHDGKVGAVSADQKEYLGDILTSSRHLLQLINDVLDLAKVESGKMEFRPETLALPKVVGEVNDVLRTLVAFNDLAGSDGVLVNQMGVHGKRVDLEARSEGKVSNEADALIGRMLSPP